MHVKFPWTLGIMAMLTCYNGSSWVSLKSAVKIPWGDHVKGAETSLLASKQDIKRIQKNIFETFHAVHTTDLNFGKLISPLRGKFQFTKLKFVTLTNKYYQQVKSCCVYILSLQLYGCKLHYSNRMSLTKLMLSIWTENRSSRMKF